MIMLFRKDGGVQYRNLCRLFFSLFWVVFCGVVDVSVGFLVFLFGCLFGMVLDSSCIVMRAVIYFRWRIA